LALLSPEKPACLEVCTNAPLGLLCSGSTRDSSGSYGLSIALNVSSLCSLARADRRALSEGGWNGIECVDIEGLRCRRSSNEGGSPKDKVRTHNERLRLKTWIEANVVDGEANVDNDADDEPTWADL
jgi:hypothetical protein